jgi:formimidoylglutamate deiminase
MIFANQALLASGWAQDVRVTLTGSRIATIETGLRPEDADCRVDTLLPAPGNLHSHAFQRAMSGMTERRQAGQDSFWTWRTLMYRFLEHLTPEQVEAITALAFMEMQEAGFASVGEFHYLHHQSGGMAFDNLAEMSERIFAAAGTTGIGLTLLPVLYRYGGAGQVPLSPEQLRFGNDVDRFQSLLLAIRQATRYLPGDTRIGVAPHSLRAVSPDDLQSLLDGHDGGPVHIHVAEQPREVVDVTAWLGQSPVAWLLDHAPVDHHWCLIHATHMTADETRRLARSGAVVGLCPVTEANLGDGPFNGPAYLDAGGAFGVGTDSNVSISLTGELRLLEYSQRLRHLARNVMVAGSGSVGQALYTGAAQGAARALARDSGEIAPGRLADLVAINSDDPALLALRRDQLLDGLVFAARDRVVTDLWSAGRHAVQQGRHRAREGIVQRYRRAMSELTSSL